MNLDHKVKYFQLQTDYKTAKSYTKENTKIHTKSKF